MKHRVFIFAALSMFLLFACSSNNVRRDTCPNCWEYEIIAGTCPYCSASICESCWYDIEGEYESSMEYEYDSGFFDGFEEGFKEGENEGFQEGYRLILDFMGDAAREKWMEENLDIVLQYDINY